ncbi:hypothetical protein BGZ49_000087 [Haplosporangium sp. Z 27]|nr:hypothetical protein BGZ49_000087 [Haplosporangium sp. Z 27]
MFSLAVVTCLLAQQVQGQSVSPSPSPTPTTIPTAVSGTPPTPTIGPGLPPQTQTIVSSANMAYGSSNSILYVQGGQGQSQTRLSQFFSLDLTSSWDVSSPAWKSLSLPTTTNTSGIVVSGGSGTLDPSGRFIVTSSQQHQTAAVYVYQQNLWQAFPLTNSQTATGPSITTVNNNTVEELYVFGLSNSLELDLHQGSGNDGSSNGGGTVLALRKTLGSSASVNANQVVVSTNQSTIWSTNTTATTIEILKFDLIAQDWTVVATTGVPPPARIKHCFIPDATGAKFYLFGGQNDTALFNDLYEFDTSTLIWTPLSLNSPGNAPEARSSMACATTQTTFVVWGGFNSVSTLAVADTTPILYDLAGKSWGLTRFTGTNLGTSTPSGSTGVPGGTGGGSGEGGKSNVGAIVGGVVGGLVVVALVGFFFIRRSKNIKSRNASVSLARSGGKSEITQNSIEMGGYKSIPSPFKSDDGYEQGVPYTSAVSTPAFSSALPYSPLDNRSGFQPQQQPYQPAYSSPSPAMSALHPRAQSQLSNASGYIQQQQTPPPIIQSPFEADPEPISQHLLTGSMPLAPTRQLHSVPQIMVGGAIAGSYHDDGHRGQDHHHNNQNNILSPSMEPATIDLIPVTESEVGSQTSRSNSLVSRRDGGGLTRNVTRGAGGAGGAGAGLLYEQEGSKRDSSESLEYLDI